MAVRREQAVEKRLEALLDELAAAPLPEAGAELDPRLPRQAALACLEAGFKSRLLDLAARELKNEGTGFYTIGSSGHEANAVLGWLLRPTDPCLLHYRSGALLAARSAKEPEDTFLWDTLLSLVASSEDPVSGGRHKVWGSKRLWVPPQTSTIASHLPKSVGMAVALARAVHLGVDTGLPEDAIVCSTFGDASVNHAVAQTAFNAAQWAAHHRLPVPILFVCEDNGIGISVRTPADWIETAFSNRPHLDWFAADGGELAEAHDVARAAIESCRSRRRPTFLHLRVVRLLGHAGSDVETTYHDEATIEATERRDPLLRFCRLAVESGYALGGELRQRYLELKERIARLARRAVTRPKLASAEEVARDLVPPTWEAIEAEARRAPDAATRQRAWKGALPERDKPRHMAMQIGRALFDLMLLHPELIVFGEDVARKGGVYHVTAGLFDAFGAGRVFNTLLDETTILGLAIGAAQVGLLPVPEIQYLAYLHNAEDQLRGEACSQRFFSRGQWDNPMVVRIAGLAYQKGFGGHFHNDDSIGVLRDIPGLLLAVPSRADDAVTMLRTLVAAARKGRAVAVFLEPIALYMTKDLHDKNDGAWSFPYPPPGEAAVLGEARHYEPEAAGETAPRILVATYGNGVPICLRARREFGPRAAVHLMDLRWLQPLPIDEFLSHAASSAAVLVVDECRKTGGGVAEALLAALCEDDRTRGLAVRRVTAADSYIPLGAAANLMLPDEAQVIAALRELVEIAEAAREPR